MMGFFDKLKGNTKALGLFAKIFDLICRQASGREGADRC